MKDTDTPAGHTHFSSILDARLSRRSLLKGSLAAAAAGYVGAGSLLLSPVGDAEAAMKRLKLNFSAVPKHTSDALRVAPGYSWTVLYATGDPLDAALPAYANDGTDDAASFARRAGSGASVASYSSSRRVNVASGFVPRVFMSEGLATSASTRSTR